MGHNCCFCTRLIGIASTWHQGKLAAGKQRKHEKELATAFASSNDGIPDYQQASLKKQQALYFYRCNIQGDAETALKEPQFPELTAPKITPILKVKH